jgi:peroxiredoxin Q/BCP
VPNFTLQDQNGISFVLAEHVGKKILVIYFYPKDESPGCTKEACAFRDSHTAFSDAGAEVIGINRGGVAEHKAFAQHHNLPFTLLSDPGKKVQNLFGVPNTFGLTGRVTFVIDREGKVAYAYNAMMQSGKHADDALATVKRLK